MKPASILLAIAMSAIGALAQAPSNVVVPSGYTMTAVAPA